MKPSPLLALFALLWAAPAAGSPWTLKRGTAAVHASFDFSLATSEFLDGGGERSFPLRGRYSGATLDLGARVGLTDRLELEASLPVRVVTYTADPAIIRPYEGSDPDEALAHYQRNVLDFSQSGAGVGDLSLAARYRLLLDPLAIAGELRLKAPTGYRGPEGTFGPTPATVREFQASGGDVVAPENIRDDVTLGDGQLDVAAQLLLGAAFSTGTFVRAGGGYNLRFGGAGDQLLGHLRIGQALGRKVLLYAFGNVAYSVQKGRSVGVTIIATDPDLPATAYARGANTEPIVRRLETDAVDVGGGLIWRIAGPVELNLSYGRTVWGKFTAATQTASLGVGIRANLFED